MTSHDPRGAASAGALPWWRRRSVLGTVAVCLVAGAAWWWFGRDDIEAGFLAHAVRGTGLPSDVQTPLYEGRGHVDPGAPVPYRNDPPTSGVHDPTWVDPGIYTSAQGKTRLVHSLEHGMIVIYYDRPDSSAMEQLRAWARLYDGQWSGIVMTPRPGLGSGFILTAWSKRLDMPVFDAAAAATFVDAYRGRGPENPVR